MNVENSSGWSVGRWLFRNCQTTTKAKISMTQTRNVLCPWRTRNPFGVGGRHGLDLSFDERKGSLEQPPHTTQSIAPKEGSVKHWFRDRRRLISVRDGGQKTLSQRRVAARGRASSAGRKPGTNKISSSTVVSTGSSRRRGRATFASINKSESLRLPRPPRGRMRSPGRGGRSRSGRDSSSASKLARAVDRLRPRGWRRRRRPPIHSHPGAEDGDRGRAPARPGRRRAPGSQVTRP